ncbi:type II toxin-antitoxin system PemK/MazF family toxin [uncultured Corynebacterium sp.]|uniref:type II toxin-antitoxin system PemK/MazF family toxin n=1 Tax=uncultured Corynebacterium sp. TaxID=159447 RepID=UPI0025D05E3B|nr:type II toxin-antitoxin system PemK/MazF family toxin [uncultured Corynebacterium sp.]
MTESARTPSNPVRRVRHFIERHFHHRGHLDRGIDELHANLGLVTRASADHADHQVTVTVPAGSLARPVIYAPDMDGQVDPGEVVWYGVVRTRDDTPELRACLIVGRNEHTLLGLLISSNPEHRTEDNWISIGTGLWDPKGNKCWVRVDRIVEIPEARIQRRGVSMPERRYDRIAGELRSRHSWT